LKLSLPYYFCQYIRLKYFDILYVYCSRRGLNSKFVPPVVNRADEEDRFVENIWTQFLFFLKRLFVEAGGGALYLILDSTTAVVQCSNYYGLHEYIF
jgi:hypothetical protein